MKIARLSAASLKWREKELTWLYCRGLYQNYCSGRNADIIIIFSPPKRYQ